MIDVFCMSHFATIICQEAVANTSALTMGLNSNY